MPEAVWHSLDQRLRAVDACKDATREIDVLYLVTASDVVHLPRVAFVEQEVNRSAMVEHVQPVPHVLSVAIERERLIVECIGNEEWNDLL